ncbi:MAG: methionine--tRNA ligase subunit beta, partial [Bacteroidota bacterium]
LAETEPWKLIKVDEERVKTILHVSLQLAANLSVLIAPFLPNTEKKLKKMLGIAEELKWSDAGRADLLSDNQQTENLGVLFEKVADELVEKQVNKLEETKKNNEVPASNVVPAKAEINFDDFMKMDMRVGTILEAEKVPKSSKLLKFKVDTGLDQRTILSGIAKFFKPEEMIGKQVTVLVNLAPRKIMGVESQGMILMAENEDGSLKLLQPHEVADNGATIS